MPAKARPSLLTAGVRVIRHVGPPEAPWPASLVRLDDDAAGWLVDAATLTDWDGWDAQPHGHVLGPLDVLRRPEGHDVLLPACSQLVETLLDRRGSSLPLSDGEVVTLAVSVLRGAAEIAERDQPEAMGRWWLSVDGRPVFIDEVGRDAAGAATIDLLERLAADTAPALSAALRSALEAVREPRSLLHELESHEAALFDAAAAEALATAPLLTTRRRLHAAETDAVPDGDSAPRSWWSAVLDGVDADLSDAFSRATTSLWRRLRRPRRRSRRRAWAVAGSLGAGVLAAGLMWPAPGGPASAEPWTSASPPPADALTETDPGAPVAPSESAPAEPAPADPAPAEPAPAPAEPAPADGQAAGATTHGDLTLTTAALLDERLDCLAAGDDRCLARVLEDPGRAFPAGAVDAAAGERTVTLLDEFGGVAVMRVEASSTFATQLVVIVAGNDRWLLRDVHDVTQQP